MWATVTEFFAAHQFFSFILRIVVATLCGALIGLERTRRSKEAGLRTHCIIACAAATIMIISQFGFSDTGLPGGGYIPGIRGADSARVAAQVVSGISFIGAGVIFKNGSTVKGLTTAAGIWATAAVGLACGSGMYGVGIFTTVVVLFIQMVMHRFNIGNDAYVNSEIRVSMVDTPEVREALQSKLKEMDITVINTKITVGEGNTMDIVLSVRMKDAIPYSEVIRVMDQFPEIRSLSV